MAEPNAYGPLVADIENSLQEELELERLASISSASSVSNFDSAPLPPSYQRLLSTFNGFYSDEYLTDISLICADGAVAAHKLILGAASPALGHVIQKVPDSDWNVSVSLPDVSLKELRAVLDAVYTGRLPGDSDDLAAVQDVMSVLGVMSEDICGNEMEESEEEEILTQMLDESSSNTPPHPPPSLAEVAPEDLQMFSLSEDADVQMVQSAKGEILLISCDGRQPHDEAELAAEEGNVRGLEGDEALRKARIDELRDFQQSICPLCNKKTLRHRTVMREATTIGDTKQPTMYAYQCCLTACSSQALRNAKAFNLHVAMHADGNGGMSYTSALGLKPCPLCFRSRLQHKNRDDGVMSGRNKKKGSLYKCCQCSAAKLSAKKFFEHAENHIAKKFRCIECNKGYSYQHLLDTHFYKMHGDGRFDVIPCMVEGCNFETKYRQSLDTHVKEKHEGDRRTHSRPADDESVVCPVCNKELKTAYYQQYHRKTCTSGNVVYKCEICEQTGFVNATTLQNHVRSKHSKDRPYGCEYCPAKYATAMSLSGHRTRKHNVNKAGEFVPKKMFPCEECGKLLTSRTKLLSHIRTVHEQKKSFSCSFCDKQFSSRSNCKLHEGAAHTGNLPYKCTMCEKSFSRKNLLANHVSAQHELRQALSEAVMEPSSSSGVVSMLDPMDAMTPPPGGEGSFFVVEGVDGEAATIGVNNIILS